MIDNLNVFIISDAIGDTGEQLLKAASAQFPNLKVNYHKYPFTRTISILQGLLNKAKREQAIIFSSFVNPELNEFTKKICDEYQLRWYDIINPAIDILKTASQQEPVLKPGTSHSLNDNYFDKIEAIEFAITYDDGKDPSGFSKADIILLGVSRTSKTPLSLYLANKGYKVANFPLVPNTSIPDEIWKLDKNKIFGLTTTTKVLNNIRRQRMISYGLDPDSKYANNDNINEELSSAKQLFDKLDCFVINTSELSIEETATLIMGHLNVN